MSGVTVSTLQGCSGHDLLKVVTGPASSSVRNTRSSQLFPASSVVLCMALPVTVLLVQSFWWSTLLFWFLSQLLPFITTTYIRRHCLLLFQPHILKVSVFQVSPQLRIKAALFACTRCYNVMSQKRIQSLFFAFNLFFLSPLPPSYLSLWCISNDCYVSNTLKDTG